MNLDIEMKRVVNYRLRQEKKVLFMRVRKEQLGCYLWQQSGVFWSKEIELVVNDEEEAQETLWTYIESKLQKILLDGDIEENIACIVLLDKRFLYNLDLKIPKLSLKDEREVLAWEAKASVPLAEGYTFAYQKLEEKEDQARVLLYALDGALRKNLESILKKNFLRCVCITMEQDLDFLAQEWYAGKELSNLLFKEKFTWKSLQDEKWWQGLQNKLQARDIQRKFVGCVAFALLLGAVGWTWQWKLERDAQELEAMAKKASVTLVAQQDGSNKEINKARSVLNNERASYAKDLLVLARQVSDGVWLTEISTLNENATKLGRTFAIKGEGDFNKVQVFLARLEEAGCKVRKLQLQNLDGNGKVLLDLEVNISNEL